MEREVENEAQELIQRFLYNTSSLIVMDIASLSDLDLDLLLDFCHSTLEHLFKLIKNSFLLFPTTGLSIDQVMFNKFMSFLIKELELENSSVLPFYEMLREKAMIDVSNFIEYYFFIYVMLCQVGQEKQSREKTVVVVKPTIMPPMIADDGSIKIKSSPQFKTKKLNELMNFLNIFGDNDVL